jgi:hypothetical protein
MTTVLQSSAGGQSDQAPPPNPGAILELGLAFWGSKTLLSAIELGLFSELAAGPRDGGDLAAALGLHPRAARDFLDALVALGMLSREGDSYANTLEADPSSTGPSRPTSAAFSRWPTPGCTRSGDG